MRFKNPMNREALALLSKDELIDLVLSLAARLDELERRLGLNSTNSGKPPSSDGLSKPPAGKQKRRRTGSLREKSGRKPGGQKGHEGETLRQVAEPDAITLIEIEKEGWARKMQRLLRRACHAANLARERGVALQPSLVEGFRRWWDAITAEGIRFHEAQPPLGPAPAEGQAKRRGRKPRRTGHNLLLLLQARKEDALRFLANLAVPFTNNQAEQDVRMAKLKQKISGGFRSEQGANDFATIRGFISTAKKQGWNIIPALMENPETLIARLRDA